jgi:hypothetical protein
MRYMSTHVRNNRGLSRREIALSLCVALFGAALCYRATEPMREQRRAGSCASNLKQIGLAVLLYTQDNNGTYPRAWSGKNDGPSDAKTNYKWMDAILPYAKDEALFVCPSDNVNSRYRYRSDANYGSYVINNAYFAPGDKWTPPAGRKEAEITAPARTVFVMDGESDFQFAWPNARTAPPFIGDNPIHLGSIRARHSIIIPMPLFCDGHVLGNRMVVYLGIKSISNQSIYTGLTIEND